MLVVRCSTSCLTVLLDHFLAELVDKVDQSSYTLWFHVRINAVAKITNIILIAELLQHSFGNSLQFVLFKEILFKWRHIEVDLIVLDCSLCQRIRRMGPDCPVKLMTHHKSFWRSLDQSSNQDRLLHNATEKFLPRRNDRLLRKLSIKSMLKINVLN